jgi:hypothetical protein
LFVFICLIYVIYICLGRVVSNTYYVVFSLCLSSFCVPYPMLSVSLDCPFCIASSAFSNVYPAATISRIFRTWTGSTAYANITQKRGSYWTIPRAMNFDYHSKHVQVLVRTNTNNSALCGGQNTQISKSYKRDMYCA